MDREEKWRTTAKRWRNEKVHTLDDAQDEDLQQPRGREKNVGNASSPLPLPLRFVARTTLFLLSPLARGCGPLSSFGYSLRLSPSLSSADNNTPHPTMEMEEDACLFSRDLNARPASRGHLNRHLPSSPNA